MMNWQEGKAEGSSDQQVPRFAEKPRAAQTHDKGHQFIERHISGAA